MSGASPLLEVSNLEVSFPVYRSGTKAEIKAVRGVSFSLEEGASLALVGESGSGKTVTTSAIPGLLSPSAACSGSIKYEGAEILGSSAEALRNARGKKIGMIFQEPGRSFDPLQNIGAVFFETFRNTDRSITKKEAAKKAAELLAETGLNNAEERLSNFPHQFSGGQLQRISIALSLAQGCSLLIADEPTTALDVTIQAQIIALLRRLKDERSLAVIFISHNIELAASLCERMTVLYGGLVMEEGPSDELLQRPLHPYSKALLAASPAFGSHYTKSRLASIPGRVTDPAFPEPGCPFAPRCSQFSADCAAAVPELVPLESGRLVRCIHPIE